MRHGAARHGTVVVIIIIKRDGGREFGKLKEAKVPINLIYK